MLDDLLEALSEMIEPAEDGESSHRSPEREALAVEPLEERIALAADVAAVAEAPAAGNLEPAPTEAAPPAETASLLPPPAIPASLIAEVQTEKAGHSPKEASPATESLGELQHEFALQIHESETPGTPRDGRIGSQRIEPGERASEQGEGGHAEHSEPHELEAREEENETLEEEVGELQSAEERYAAEAGHDATSPAGTETPNDQHAVEQAAVRGEEPIQSLAAENNLSLATEIESGVDRQSHEHEVAREDADLALVAERPQPSAEQTMPSIEREPAGVVLESAVIGSHPLAKDDAPPERLFDGDKPPSAEEMLSEEVKAHDACFSAPIEHPAALAALPDANTQPAPRQQP